MPILLVPVIVSSNTIKVVHRNNHCLKIGVKIFYSAILNINVNIVFVFFILNLFNFINPKANIINETNLVRHDPVKLSRTIMKMVYDLKSNSERMKLLDYYLINDNVKEQRTE